MKTFLLVLSLFASNTIWATEPGASFENTAAMIQELNLRPYFKLPAKKKLKIAVLDNGFRFAKDEIGNSLPAETILHAPVLPAAGEEEAHGFYMARILWSLLSLDGTDTRFQPELHLYPTYGYSNLKAAVDDLIARQVDIVLYSQTWEYGGNFDGHGFINALVNRATAAGVLWINNSGNSGKTTFNSRIANGADNWVKLPGQNSSVELRCQKNPTGKCALRAVLSWNSFSDDVNTGTDKDLDFVLTDDTLNIVQSSNLRQSPTESGPGISKYPREIITAEVPPGQYFLRVKNRSNNFTDSDRLRITVDGDFLTMTQADAKESLLPPADNPSAITVGALDSDRTSISQRLHKPEIWSNSLVRISQDEDFLGTSNAAAKVAAGIAVLKSVKPSLNREGILALVSQAQQPSKGNGLALISLNFQATTSEGCFAPVKDSAPDYVQDYLKQGTLVETSAGWKVFFPFDPIRLLSGIRRYVFNDILVTAPDGVGIYNRNYQYQLPSTTVELLQTPMGESICGQGNTIPFGSIFALPKPSLL